MTSPAEPEPPAEQAAAAGAAEAPATELASEVGEAVDEVVEEVVEEVVGEVVDPEDVRRVAREVAYERIETFIEQTTGIFPPPGMLERYEQIHPGFMGELLTEFKAEGQHRRKLERRSLTAQISITLLGQILAFAVAIAGLGFGAYLINEGRSISGYAVLVTAVGGIVASFLYLRKEDDGSSTPQSASAEIDKAR